MTFRTTAEPMPWVAIVNAASVPDTPFVVSNR